MNTEPKFKPLRAKTIREISGNRIQTIPIGTEFLVTFYNIDSLSYSSCTGLNNNNPPFGITLIYNDEFEFIPETNDAIA